MKKLFLLFLATLFSLHYFAKDFYWIGNSGNWKNQSHWSLSSGGAPSNLLPSSNDKVFIDENSFNSTTGIITVNQNINVKAMYLQSAIPVTLESASPSTLITINTFFEANSNFINKFEGTIYFKSSNKPSGISLTGQKILGNLIIENQSEFTVSSSLIFKNKKGIKLNSGNIKVKNATIFSSFLKVNSSSKSTVNLDSKSLWYNKELLAIDSPNFFLKGNKSSFIVHPNALIINKSLTEASRAEVSLQATTCSGNPNVIISMVKYPAYPSGSDVSCVNTCDGRAIVKVSGGVGPFTYDWVGYGAGGFTDKDTILNLCKGIAYVLIKDNGQGGLICTEPVTIKDATPVSFEVITTPICPPSACSGKAYVRANNGTKIKSVLWSPSNSTADTIKNLCAGNYSVLARNLNNCPLTKNFKIDSSQITITPTITNVDCEGSCNGKINLNPGANAINNYSYSWEKPLRNSPEIINLCADTYRIAITDTIGCVLRDTFILPKKDLLEVTFTTTNVNCKGKCTGSITSSIQGGTPPYSFKWSNKSTSQNLNNLCEGTYTLTVIDANGCSVDKSSTISSTTSTPISTAFTKILPTSCMNCDGQITTTVTGQTGVNYTVAWDDPATQTGNMASNLCSKLYRAIITGDDGCIDTSFVALEDRDGPSLTVPKDTVCFNTKGDVSIMATTVAPPLSYSWKNFASVTNEIKNVSPGEYFVTVQDGAGCKKIDTVNLIEADQINVPFSSKDPNCNYSNNGEIEANPTGGRGTYSYRWETSPVRTTKKIDALSAGKYKVTITDSKGCTSTDSIELKAPELLLSMSQKAPSCNGGCNGVAYVEVSGGKAPFNYTWDKFPLAKGAILPNACGDSTYTVIVTDANNCVRSSKVTITNPTKISVDFSDFDSVSCLNVCDASAYIKIKGGVKPYTYSWNTSQNKTNIPKNLLCLGENTMTVKDFNGCTFSFNILVPSKDSLKISAKPSKDTLCLEESVILRGTLVNGFFNTVEWTSLSSNASLGNTQDITYTPKAIGKECFKILVKNNTCSYSDTTCIEVLKPDVSLSSNLAGLLRIGGTVDITTSSSTGVDFAWSPNTKISDATAKNPTVNPTVSTRYKVTVKDIYKCVDTASILINVTSLITPPDAITPNNDGKNDLWKIQGLVEFPENKVTIMTKWGDIIYEKDNYDNSWDGTKNGTRLPIGTYYYILEIDDERVKKPITGAVTIIR